MFRSWHANNIMTKCLQQAASELALKKRQEQLRNEFQPPKTESDDETDEDLEHDVDLSR